MRAFGRIVAVAVLAGGAAIGGASGAQAATAVPTPAQVCTVLTGQQLPGVVPPQVAVTVSAAVAAVCGNNQNWD